MTDIEKKKHQVVLLALRTIMTQEIKEILETHNDLIVKNMEGTMFIDFFVPRISTLMKNCTQMPFDLLISLVLVEFNEDKDILSIECAMLKDPEIVASLVNPYERFKFRICTCPDFIKRRNERLQDNQAKAKGSGMTRVPSGKRIKQK